MLDEHIQERATGQRAHAPEVDAPEGLAPTEDEMLVFCPRCFRATDSLKRYQIFKLAFLLAAYIWNYEVVIACPSCMRKAIAWRTLLAVFLSNLAFPLVAMVYLWQWCATFTHGHSNAWVAEANRRRPDQRFGALDKAITRWTWLGWTQDPFLRYVVRMVAFVAIGLVAVIAFGVIVSIVYSPAK